MKYLYLITILHLSITYSYGSTKEILGDDSLFVDSDTLLANKYYNKGYDLFIKKKYAQAVDDFDLFILSNPNDANAYKYRGRCKYLLNDNDNALKDYNLSSSLKGVFDENLYIYRAEVKAKLKDYKGAIEDANLVIKYNPDSSYVFFIRASYKYKIKDYKGAIIDYTQVIKISPNDIEAFNNRGASRYKLDDYRGAIED